MEVVRNRYDILVKMQCASCEHKSMTRASCRRWCSRHKNFVEPHGCCEDWRMSRQLQRLGAQKGIVKSREHLMAAHRKAIEN